MADCKFNINSRMLPMGKVGYQRLGELQMSGLGPTVVAVKWIVGVSGDELGGTGNIGPKLHLVFQNSIVNPPVGVSSQYLGSFKVVSQSRCGCNCRVKGDLLGCQLRVDGTWNKVLLLQWGNPLVKSCISTSNSPKRPEIEPMLQGSPLTK